MNYQDQTAASQKYVERKIQASADSTLDTAKSYVREQIAGKADLIGGKVPAVQLPGFVDDVIEAESADAFPQPGESGKIYLALDTNMAYRWGGSTYAAISTSLALGETADAAFPGNRGKAVEEAVKKEQGRAQTAEQSLGTRIDGLVSGKAAAVHTHPVSDVTGLQEAIDGAAKSVQDALQGDVAAIPALVSRAERATETATKAATDAAKAQQGAEEAEAGAEAAKEAAEIALNNGCVYEVREVDSSAIQLAKTLTAYKHTPTADTAYTFTAPEGVEGKIIVFWLWIVMGNSAHQLTFPSTVTWITEGSFGANTQTLLALMSTDAGASWVANVQWEREVTA